MKGWILIAQSHSAGAHQWASVPWALRTDGQVMDEVGALGCDGGVTGARGHQIQVLGAWLYPAAASSHTCPIHPVPAVAIFCSCKKSS